MSEDLDRRVLRALGGEATSEELEALRRLTAADAEAAERRRRLERLWRDLDLPRPAAAPPSLLDAVRAGISREEGPLWGAAPLLGRALAAATLAAGIGLGVWAGSLLDVSSGAGFGVEPSLAESYWSTLSRSGGDLREGGR